MISDVSDWCNVHLRNRMKEKLVPLKETHEGGR